MSPVAASVNDTIVRTLPQLEAAARRQQRLAHALQALYLLVLLLAPAERLLPLQASDRGVIDSRVAAGLLLTAVVLRLVMRRVGAETDWVQARRRAEEERSGAWQRAVTAAPVQPQDGDVVRDIARLPVARRWATYRTERIDDQIAYFDRCAREHGGAAHRWLLLRHLLTVATLGIAAVALVGPDPLAPGTVGAVSAVLATTEAWIQFRRSEVVADSYREAGRALAELRPLVPADEAALAAAVDAVERALERERWTWTAIMSVTVLTPARGSGGGVRP